MKEFHQLPVHLRAMADAVVEDALKAGLIERTTEGDACSPAHFVEKTDSAGNITGVRLVLVDRPTQLICISDIYLLSWRW